uniref:Major facilitator superfamily (MFS) profile domain-containing protein n=1 Tax=Parascaris equorum TaxID=6256 RepID=A0A914RC71_PAREQ
MTHKFRLIILLLASACLSMMMANILTLNFCILCMTENQFTYEDQNIKFGYDIFQSIASGESFTSGVASDAIAELSPLKYSSFFIYSHFCIHCVILGFNFTAIDPKLTASAKEHIIGVAEATSELMNAEGKKVSKWMKTKPEDLELRNLTWDGVVSLRRRVIAKRADYEYNAQERSILFAAIAIGALIAIIPITAGIHRYGCRKSFTAVGVIAATATAFCPLAASFGIIPFTFMRMLQGVGYAACMPVIGSVTSTWASLGESGLFSGALTSFIQLPLRRIYTSLSAWAVWIAAIGNMCSIQMVVVFAPTYLNQVRVFNSIAFIGMGSFLVALALLPNSSPLVALACLIGSATVLGFNTGGFFKS